MAAGLLWWTKFRGIMYSELVKLICKDCGVELSDRHKKDLCRSCYMIRFRASSRSCVVKVCGECGVLLGVRNRLGLCRSCSQKVWRKSNSERLKAKGKKYWKDNKERLNKAATKKYYADHEATKKRQRELYWTHPEESRLRARVWTINNRHRVNEMQAERRRNPSEEQLKAQRVINKKRRGGLSVEVYKGLVQQVYERNIKKYGTLTCYLCDKHIVFDDNLEHKVPISRGGLTVSGNLDVAHAFCNLRKNNRSVEEFKAVFGGLNV